MSKRYARATLGHSGIGVSLGIGNWELGIGCDDTAYKGREQLADA